MTCLEERAYRLTFADRSHEHMFASGEDRHRLTIELARACWNGLQAGLRSRCSKELGGSNPSARISMVVSLLENGPVRSWCAGPFRSRGAEGVVAGLVSGRLAAGAAQNDGNRPRAVGP